MKKLSGVAIVTTAEGERVSYTYTELMATSPARTTGPHSWLWMRSFLPLSKP